MPPPYWGFFKTVVPGNSLERESYRDESTIRAAGRFVKSAGFTPGVRTAIITAVLEADASPVRKWRNWQTRKPQEFMAERL
jgi:hypothetical protein